MKKFITLPDVRNVVATGTAIVNVPVGPTYHYIQIAYKEAGTLAAETDLEDAITGIRVKINGKTQREFTGAELNDLNAVRGITFEAGMIQIFFAEPWRTSVQAEDILAWGTGDVDTFQIEIDITGGTTPTMEARALVDDSRRNMGIIKKVRQRLCERA